MSGLKRLQDAAWHLREHVGDLIGVILLLGAFFAFDKAAPRRTFLTAVTLYKHSMPYRDNTVPAWAVLFLGFILPVIVFVLHKLLYSRTWRDTYRVTVARLVAVALTGLITNLLKVPIGRPRPNFVFRCWPDGNQVYKLQNEFGGFAICSCSQKVENEHRKSFPSGHSSIAASGLGFLSYFLLAQSRAFTGNGHSWRIVLSLLPAVVAVGVGVTRVVDYWHHPSDVGVGLALGFGISMLVYLQLFPWFSHPECDFPRSVSAQLEGGNASPKGANRTISRRRSWNAASHADDLALVGQQTV